MKIFLLFHLLYSEEKLIIIGLLLHPKSLLFSFKSAQRSLNEIAAFIIIF